MGRPVFVNGYLVGQVDSDIVLQHEGETSLEGIFGDTLCCKGSDGKIITGNTSELLAGKVVALVVDSLEARGTSAWDLEEDTLSILTRRYEKYRAKGLDFQVVFVSADENEDGFLKMYDEMPWLAVPFENLQQRRLLCERFKLHGVPSTALVSAEMKLVQSDVNRIIKDIYGKHFPWEDKDFFDILGPKIYCKTGLTKQIEFSTATGEDAGGWSPDGRGFGTHRPSARSMHARGLDNMDLDIEKGACSVDVLKNKKLGLFFCSHLSLTSDQMNAKMNSYLRLHAQRYLRGTLKLAKVCEKLKDTLEVVVVDTSGTQQTSTLVKQLTGLPFKYFIPSESSEGPCVDELVEHFQLHRIGNTSPPLCSHSLVMVDETNGQLMNIDAMGTYIDEDENDDVDEASVDAMVSCFPWKQPAIADFKGAEGKCCGWSWDTSRASALVMFTDTVDEKQREEARAALEPIATEYIARKTFGGQQEMLFFMAGPATEASEKRTLVEIRQALGLPSSGVILMMRANDSSSYDDKSEFYYSALESTSPTDEIRDFTINFKDKKRCFV